MRSRLLKVLFILTSITGSVHVQAAESHILYDKEGVDVIASDASQTVSYIKKENSKDQYCAGTGSDFAGYSGKGFSFGGKDAMGQGGVGFNDTHGVQSFGGRTPLVLITREMMFRACELSLNTDSNREQSIEIYKLFLQTLQTLGGDQQLSGTSVSSSSAVAEKPKSPQSSTENSSTSDDESTYSVDSASSDDVDDVSAGG